MGMKKIKEFLQKKKGSVPVIILTCTTVVLCLIIGLQAGKMKNIFNPDFFVSEEEQQEQFDPKGYGLREDGKKRGEEENTENDLLEQEEMDSQIQNLEEGRNTSQTGRQKTGEDDISSEKRIVYVDRKTGEGLARQTKGDTNPADENNSIGDKVQTEQPENTTQKDDVVPDDEEGESGGNQGEDNEDNDTQNPGDGDTEVHWIADDITITYFKGKDAVDLYKEQVPSESYIKGNITVTTHWVEKGNPKNQKTEEETDFILGTIPEEFAHRLTDADVNKNFSVTVSCHGLTDTVNCVVKNDYIRYTSMKVYYNNKPMYVTGETLFRGSEVNDTAIRDAITLDVYGRTVQGGQDVYLPDENNYQIQFQEETGGIAAKKQDGTDWKASIVYCGPGEGTSAVLTGENAVSYSVRDYKLTVMYDETTVLDTIYTDDETVVLNASYDGNCPYNDMIKKLQENGKFIINEDGYLSDLFYGWSSTYPATVENKEISYTFKEGQHTQVMYAIPLTPLLEEGYLVKTEGNHQILCGYVPQNQVDCLDVPYGITRLEINDQFLVSKQAKRIKILALSATVNSVELTTVGQKFPQLEEYSVRTQQEDAVEKNYIFKTEDGLLYSADMHTLWKVPTKCQQFTVNEQTERIAEGAFTDAAAGTEVSECLSICMQSDRPPTLVQTDTMPVFGNSVCQIQIEVPDTKDHVVEDLIYKRYLSAWGEILDKELGKTGAAAQCLFTQNGIEKKYENHGNNVYIMKNGTCYLAFVTGKEEMIYQIPKEVEGISAYAFSEPGQIRFVDIGENVKELEENCFVSVGTQQLQGVQIQNDTEISIAENILGEEASCEMKIYISLAQNEASGWIKRLTEDYGAESAKRMLLLAEGTLYVDTEGCAYFIKKGEEKSLILCSVPKDIKEYRVPEGYDVIEVAAEAFSDCNQLVYLELPAVKKLGRNAFKNCEKLEIVVLSNPEMTEISDCFSGCNSLETLLLGNESLSPALPQQAVVLAGKNYMASGRIIYEKNETDGFTVLNVPTDAEGKVFFKNGTNVIDKDALAGCKKITELDTDQLNSITSIGEHAFLGCTGLREAMIGQKCTFVGKEAFKGCSGLETVTWLGDTKAVGDAVFSDNKKIEVVYFGDDTEKYITTVGNSTFENCTGLQTVYYEAGVKEIGNSCFRGCSSMRTSIEGTYAAACERIGAYAFADCARYSQTLALYSGLQEIGEGAFLNCTYLKSMWIPSQLKEIPDACFAGCSAMKTFVVQVDAELVSVGEYAFSGCISLSELTNFELLTKIQTIGKSAFSESTIENNHYDACTALKTIVLPVSLQKIDTRAFYACDSLEEMDASQAYNLSELGEGVFMNCSSLKNAGFGSTKLQKLSDHTFSGCSAMEILLLPETVTAIGSRAVADCSNLSEINISNKNTVVSVKSNSFSGTKKNKNLTIYVPYTDGHALRNAYWQSFDWWWALRDAANWQSLCTIIKDRVMEEETFVENGGLYEKKYDGTYCLLQILSAKENSFTVKQNTTEIKEDALRYCEDLAVLVLPATLKTLPQGILANCATLEVLFIPSGLQLPVLEGDLFAGEKPNDSFAIWVCDSDERYYKNWSNLPVRAYGSMGEVNNGVIYGVKGQNADMRILLQYVPKSFEGELNILLGTVEIAEAAAKDCKGITALNSAYTVEKIGKEAFAGCTSLETVNLTNTSLTALKEIDDYAFYGCTLLTGDGEEGLTIPATVEQFGKGVLKNCISLSVLSMQGRTEEIPDEFCSGCKKLSSLSLTRTLLNSVTRIGKKAFYQCEKLTSISWSNMPNLKIVDDSAYKDCTSLVQATFAANIEMLGDEVFHNTALEILSFNGENPPELGNDILEEEEQQRIKIYIPAGENGNIYLKYYEAWEKTYPVLASRLIAGDGNEYRAVNNILYLVNAQRQEELTAVQAPTGIKEAVLYNSSTLYCVRLEDNSFQGCRLLESVIIPNRVTTIGNHVFENCSSLQNISIEGDALRSIGWETFKNCTSLKTLTIPASVYSMGDGMLSGCSSFEKLTVKSFTPFALGKKIFGESVRENVRIVVPMASYETYLSQWGSQLDGEYGTGTGKQLLMAVSSDGTEKIENGICYVWIDGNWQEKEKIDDASKKEEQKKEDASDDSITDDTEKEITENAEQPTNSEISTEDAETGMTEEETETAEEPSLEENAEETASEEETSSTQEEDLDESQDDAVVSNSEEKTSESTGQINDGDPTEKDMSMEKIPEEKELGKGKS